MMHLHLHRRRRVMVRHGWRGGRDFGNELPDTPRVGKSATQQPSL